MTPAEGPPTHTSHHATGAGAAAGATVEPKAALLLLLAVVDMGLLLLVMVSLLGKVPPAARPPQVGQAPVPGRDLALRDDKLQPLGLHSIANWHVFGSDCMSVYLCSTLNAGVITASVSYS